MSGIKSKEIPLAIAAVTVFYLFIEYFFNLPPVFADATSYLKNTGVIISAFAMILAAVNVFLIHGSKILKKSKGWLYDAYFIALFVIVIAIGVPLSTRQPVYAWIIQYLYGPGATSTWAIMSLYYVTALYMVWRIKSVESVILLVAGLTTLLNNAPAMAVIFPPILQISNWVQNVPNLAGKWGIELAVGVGMVAIGIRVMLLLERHFISGSE